MKFPIPFLDWTGRVSLEIEIPGDTAEHWRLRAAVEIAVKSGARLDGARLDGARLDGASLDGASLDGAHKLIGQRPYFAIGPIGSRCATLQTFITDHGVHVRAGCFSGSLADFEAAVVREHGSNIHAREYAAAVAMIKAHAEAWTPAQAEAAQ